MENKKVQLYLKNIFVWISAFIGLVVIFYFIRAYKNQQTFMNNQRCLELRPEITSSLEERSGEIVIRALDEIFYSPRENTCMYSFITYLREENPKIKRTELHVTQMVIRKYSNAGTEYARFDENGRNDMLGTTFSETKNKLKQPRW